MSNLEFKGLRYILMDIEGTTSDIRFVKDVLFPYADENMAAFFEKNPEHPLVREATETLGQGDAAAAVRQLRQWIHADIKQPLLKKIQGELWKQGYEGGHYRAHIYPDVVPAWQKWREQGLQLGLYSSGSVQAQILFFRYSEAGDLLPFLSHQFDLDMGGKKEATSYERILQALQFPATQVLFLSDVPAELYAARQAGLQVAHVCRPGTSPVKDLPTLYSFNDLRFLD